MSPDPDVPLHQLVSARGVVDDPAPPEVRDRKPAFVPTPHNRAEPVWPGHPKWCGCNDCVNGTPPPELALTKVEIDTEVRGTRTLTYWSDGSVTWKKTTP